MLFNFTVSVAIGMPKGLIDFTHFQCTSYYGLENLNIIFSIKEVHLHWKNVLVDRLFTWLRFEHYTERPAVDIA